MKKPFVIAIAAAALALSGCDFIEGLFGADQTADRPAIPAMETYLAGLPYISEELVVEQVSPSTFSALVTTARNADGNTIFADQSNRMDLVLNGALVLHPTCSAYPSTAYQALSAAPVLQLARYWVRVGEIKRYAGGTVTSYTYSKTTGTESTEAYSFTETLGLSATASGGVGFAEVETTVSAEFSATQSFESTFAQETTVEETVEIAPEIGKNVAYAVWQLYEEFRFVNATPNADGEYELFTDPKYAFATPESQFRFISPTDTVVEKAYIFNQ